MAPDSDVQSAVCLGVAVDHRIRRLFAPVTTDSTKPPKPSAHVANLGAFGLSRELDDNEIQVTQQLAGPATKGGIAVVLQQPRPNHPFEGGVDAVIDDCETLLALDEIFTVASCGTLTIRDNISVVDLLPYMTQKASDPSCPTAGLVASFRASVQAICAKEPDVLLCAGKIWLPGTATSSLPKGDAMKLESIGVGKSFGSKPTLPILTKIRSEEGGFVGIRRVNGFHPSYAVNFQAHVSLLRQLQVLVAAETCGTLRNNWKNEGWMDVLRNRCQELAKSLSGAPRFGVKDISDYRQMYSEKLYKLQANVTYVFLASVPGGSGSGSLYQILLDLDLGLSELCNDASLILRQMLRLENMGRSNLEVLERVAVETLYFARFVINAARKCGNPELKAIMRGGAAFIHDQVKSKNSLNTKGACEAFLALATDIESLLLDLCIQQEHEILARRQEAVLSSMMGNMSLQEASIAATA